MEPSISVTLSLGGSDIGLNIGTPVPWYQSTCEMSLRAKTAQWPSTHNVICVDCTQTQLRIVVRRIPFRKNPYMTSLDLSSGLWVGVGGAGMARGA